VSRRPVLLLLLAGALGGCGGSAPIPDHDLMIRVESDSNEVQLGRAFSLEVVRVHLEELEPEPWSDERLFPLTVRLAESSRRTGEGRVEERLRFRAWAFRPGRITVPAPVIVARPRGGGPERTAEGRPLVLSVGPEIDLETPGPVELPEPLSRPGFPWLPVAAGAVGLLAAGVLLLRRRRRRSPPAEEAEEGTTAETDEGPSLRERTLARLEDLRRRTAETDEEIRDLFEALAALLRDYLEERFGTPAAVRTTEEILADRASDVDDVGRAVLTEALHACDLVKFAGRRPSRPEHGRPLDAAAAFVDLTGEEAS
jgi:hypothetical protein